MHVRRLTEAQAREARDDLAEILKDAVDGDAGLGFLPPLAIEEARAYWDERIPDLGGGHGVLVVADENGRLVGSAQLDLSRRPNGRHRAEVCKVMVHSRWRGRGVGRALLDALEAEARRHGRTLLHLDTFHGDVGERLYRAAGYSFSGTIPEFALRADGKPHATAIYYKVLR